MTPPHRYLYMRNLLGLDMGEKLSDTESMRLTMTEKEIGELILLLDMNKIKALDNLNIRCQIALLRNQLK